MEIEIDNINNLMKNMSLVKKPITNTDLRNKFRDVKVVCNYKKINLNAGKLYMLSITTDPHVDNFFLISTMIRANGKLIREKIGQHLVQGMNLIAGKYLDEDLIIESFSEELAVFEENILVDNFEMNFENLITFYHKIKLNYPYSNIMQLFLNISTSFDKNFEKLCKSIYSHQSNSF